ncbi:MAG: CPBP family intramembrane glutamic endopeptidase [Terriglobales bacterium]
MSDGIFVKDTVSESAHSASFWRRIFLGSRGIRSGWRLTIFLLILAGSVFGVFAIGVLRIPAAARIFNQGFLSPSLEYLTEIPTAMCLLVCSLVMGRIEKRGPRDYGLSLRRGTGEHFLWGLFWGVCLFSGVIGLIAALHGFSFGGLALHGLALLKYASLWAIGFLLVGFVEEFLYRGYVQFTLAQAIGFWPAAVVLSLTFGAVHLLNPGENLVGALEVFLFAMFACLTLRRTGTLWFAIGFHAAGDYAETFLFSVRDSGYAASGTLLNSSFHGPAWVTGGKVGPEASVFSMLTLIVAMFCFHLLYPRASRREEVYS